MVNYRCFVNNKETELGELSFEIIKTISDYKSLEARGTITKDLSFPATPINNDVFGFLYDLNSYDNYDTTKKYPILLYADNYLLLDGWFEMTDVIKEYKKPIEYKGVAYADNNIFFTNLKDKDMYDLDISELNFTLSNSFVYNTYYYEQIGVNNNAAIYTNIGFPYVDYGKNTKGWLGDFNSISNIGFQCDDVYPGIKAKYLIDKIFADADCSYESTFLESDEFSKFIIPFCNDLNEVSSGNSILTASGYSAMNYYMDRYLEAQWGGGTNSNPNAWDITNLVRYVRNPALPQNGDDPSTCGIIPITWTYEKYVDSKYTDSDRADSNITLTNFLHSTIRFQYDCKVRFESSFKFKYTQTPTLIHTGQQALLLLCKSKWSDAPHINQSAAAVAISQNFEVVSQSAFTIGTGTFDVIFNTPEVEVEANDVFFFQWQFPPKIFGTGTYLGKYHYGYTNTNYVKVYTNDEWVNGIDVWMDKFFYNKDIKQSDFLLDIMKMFNLQIYPDANNKNHYHLETYDDFINRTNAFVLTDYIDETMEELEFVNNYKTFNFSYKYDDIWLNKYYKDRYNKEYGSYKYETDNELTDTEVDIKLDVFAAAPLVQLQTSFFNYSSGTYCDPILSAVYKEDYFRTQVSFNQFPDTNIEPRFLYYDLKNTLYSNHYYKFNYTYFNLPFATHMGPNPHGILYTGSTAPYTSSQTYEFENTYDYMFDTDRVFVTTIKPISNQNLVNRFYGQFISDVFSSESKLYKARFNLPFSIINQIELNKMVYIDREGYFLINEMRITPDALTEMVLIKLDDVTYNYTKYKGKKIAGLTPLPFPGNIVDGPTDNINGTIFGTGNVVNFSNLTIESSSYTYTIWYDSGGTSGTTAFPDSTAITYFNYTPLSYRYDPITGTSINVFGNDNIVLPNTQGVFINGSGNYIDEGAKNVSIMNSNGIYVEKQTDGVSVLGSENITVSTGISNLILIGKKDLTLIDSTETNKIYIGDTTGMTVDMRGTFTMQGKMTWDPNETGDISVQGHRLYFDESELSYMDYNSSQVSLQTWIYGSRTMIHTETYSFMYAGGGSGPLIRNIEGNYTAATFCPYQLGSGIGGYTENVSIISNNIEGIRVTSSCTYIMNDCLKDSSGNSYITSAGAITTLSGLTDVSITSPTNGDILYYDDSIWYNGSIQKNILTADTSLTATTNIDLIICSGSTNFTVYLPTSLSYDEIKIKNITSTEVLIIAIDGLIDGVSGQTLYEYDSIDLFSYDGNYYIV
jgi:hypothetical protein